VINEPVLAELVDQCDTVYHLAPPWRAVDRGSAGAHDRDERARHRVVLKQAAKKGKMVLIASTSEVYGKSTDVPFREDGDLALGPPAAIAGLRLQQGARRVLALAYWKEKKLPVVIVRLFNTVGPRQTGRYGMVVPTFVQQALAGEPSRVRRRRTDAVLHVRE